MTHPTYGKHMEDTANDKRIFTRIQGTIRSLEGVDYLRVKVADTVYIVPKLAAPQTIRAILGALSN